MAMKKELRIGLEEVRQILSGLEMIHPNNKMNIGRKGLGSTALSEIVPDCVSMIENILWCDRFNTSLKDEIFYVTLEQVKKKKANILERVAKLDDNPIDIQ